MDLKSEDISRLLRYEDGKLFWKERNLDSFPSERVGRAWNRRFANTEAGTKRLENGNLYIYISIHGRVYPAHRLIWMLFNGSVPDNVDHFNGNSLDNRIENLRNVTPKMNSRNMRRHVTNKSGISGVHWCATRNKWVVQCQINSKTSSLGRFDDFFEACCKRKSWEVGKGYTERHGRV